MPDVSLSVRINTPSPKSLLEELENKKRIENRQGVSQTSAVNASDLIKRGQRARLNDLNFPNKNVEREDAISRAERNQFIMDNKDLLHVIDNSDHALDLLSRSQVSKRDDLQNIIAQTAHQLLNKKTQSKISASDLKRESILSSMIVLNSGGVRDFINDKSEESSGILNQKTQYNQIINKLIGKLASSQFDKDHTLNDEEFFTENTDAALYVLSDSEAVKDFNLNTTNASTFKARVLSSDSESFLENHINQKAALSVEGLSNQGIYDVDFFEDNHRLAQAVVAGEFIDEVPTTGTYLSQNLTYALGNNVADSGYDLEEIGSQILAEHAFSRLNGASSLTTNFLKQNQGVASLILSNEEFRNILKDNKTENDLKLLTGKNLSSIRLSNTLINQIENSFQSKNQNLGLLYSLNV